MKEFHGIIPPIITPLHQDGSLDVFGLERLLEFLLSNGVHGIFVLGTTGEGPALCTKTQHDMITETIRIVNGRVPVLAGVSDTSFEKSIDLALFAGKAGAAGIVSAPPCYFLLEEPELIDFYTALAKQAAMPLFLYNMPAQTKIYMNPELICKLAQIPNVRGYKDSSGNMLDFHTVLIELAGKEDFSIFIGPEELLGEAVLYGADGGVSAGANLHPEIFTAMYHAAINRDIDAVRELQKRIYRQRKLYAIEHHQTCLTKAVKTALQQQGICEKYTAMPIRYFEQREAEIVSEIAAKI